MVRIEMDWPRPPHRAVLWHGHAGAANGGGYSRHSIVFWDKKQAEHSGTARFFAKQQKAVAPSRLDIALKAQTTSDRAMCVGRFAAPGDKTLQSDSGSM